MKPLESVRIIDLTQILSGPFATQILADLGAEVIKVEPLWGDKARQNGPMVDNRSTYFASLNRGKQSLAVDLKNSDGKAIVEQLAQTADVLVENFRPGVLTNLGLGYEHLKHHNPRLIYAACSGFGWGSPDSARPALDVVIQAMAGSMSLTGTPNGDPIKVGFSVGDIGAGLYLALGILAALELRHQTGQGTCVDISMLESQVAFLENAYARYFATGEVPGPLGSRHAVMAPFQAFATQDGYVVVAVSSSAHWQAFCAVLELPQLVNDDTLCTAEGRVEHRNRWEGVVAQRISSETTQYWLQRLAEKNIPAGPIYSVAEASRQPALASSDFFVNVDYGGVPFRVVGTPLHFDRERVIHGGAVPQLGTQTEGVLKNLLDMDSDTIRALYEKGVVR